MLERGLGHSLAAYPPSRSSSPDRLRQRPCEAGRGRDGNRMAGRCIPPVPAAVGRDASTRVLHLGAAEAVVLLACRQCCVQGSLGPCWLPVPVLSWLVGTLRTCEGP